MKTPRYSRLRIAFLLLILCGVFIFVLAYAPRTPPSHAKWDSLVASLKIGDQKTNIEAQLLAFNIKPSGGAGEQLESIEYYLDDTWVLICCYQYQGQYLGHETLYSRDLILRHTK